MEEIKEQNTNQIKKQMGKKIAAFVIDLLLAGLILLVFAYFQHGKKYLDGKRAAAEAVPQVYTSASLLPQSSDLNVTGLPCSIMEGRVEL